jgi:excinuclease UvrABC helicase subunit UvrB
VPIPRVKLSKKERRKLRKEYREARGLEPSELAKKILETPVINPIQNKEDKTEAVSEDTQAELDKV